MLVCALGHAWPARAQNAQDAYGLNAEVMRLYPAAIAALKLDADWVILSACNTAGGAGQGEVADALSGPACMFFYAGGAGAARLALVR